MRFLLTLVAAIVCAGVARAQGNDCFECHSDEDQTAVPIFVSKERFAASRHGTEKVGCADCHRGSEFESHPGRVLPGRRAYAADLSGGCRRCHEKIAEKFSDGVHARIFAEGNEKAAVCSDCHDPHATADPKRSKAAASRICASCHGAIFDKFAGSVHGNALLHEDNTDVPSCVDCHPAHATEDPRDTRFHLASGDLCAGCHGDAKRMRRYGISTDVVQTYVQDFHGVSVGYYRKEGPPAGARLTPTCIDCHGIHDIMKAGNGGAGSPAVRENLAAVCRKCHPGATPNFSGAWLSHYIPSPATAPVVWLVKLFYWIFIPFVIGGLIVHIILDFVKLIVRGASRQGR